MRTPKPPPARSYRHPLYGDIPLLPVTWSDAEGRVYQSYAFDLSYAPPLPKGALRGNPHRQRFFSAFDVPRYFYLDREQRCVQCSDTFVFSAPEQKHWYETLQFNPASVAIRCRSCRRRRRTDKALHHAVQHAKEQLTSAPDDPAAQLALAEAIVQLRQRLGRGDLNQAIAAARRARAPRKAPPSTRWLADTLYWEASAQALAGRDAKARALFQDFLAHARGKLQRKRVQRANAWLEQHVGG